MKNLFFTWRFWKHGGLFMNIYNMFRLCIHKAFKSKQISKNNLHDYIISPFLTSTVFCLMNNEQDIKLILAGVSIIVFWSINIFESSYLVIDEKAFGTLGSILVSPFRTQFILFSEVLCTIVLNIPAVIVVFLAGYCITPFTLSITELLGFGLAYLLSILSISTIGLLVATLLLFTRSARGIMNIIEYPFYLLSGVLIPIEQLPLFFRWISYLLPTTHAFHIFHSVLAGNIMEIKESLLKCLVGIIIFHFIIARVIHFTEKQILIKGTIDIY